MITPGFLPFCFAAGLLWGGTQVLLVIVVAFLVACLVVSHLRFERVTALAAKDEEGVLGVREAFLVQVADMISRTRPEAPDLVVMVVEATALAGEGRAAESLRARLARQVRRTDRVALIDERRIGLILSAGRLSAERIAERLTEDPGDTLIPLIRVGVATLPENSERAASLVEAAEQALLDNEAAGTSWVVAPAPDGETALDPGPEEHPAEDRHSARVVDTLTGVMRPDRLENALQKFVARHRKETMPVSIVYIGVDRFESYLEHYGREGSNDIRRGIADILDGAVRVTDILGRHGEETFVAAMDCAWQDALGASERMAALLKVSVVTAGASGVKATVSCGVAGYPDHGRAARRLFEAAHLAQRMASARGRGVCLSYDRAMRHTLTLDETVDTL